MEEKKFTIGGDLEKALKGEYNFNAESVLKEGWEITKKGKSVLLLGAMLIMWICLGFFIFVAQFVELAEPMAIPPVPRLLIDVSLTVLLAPFLAALEMTGISNSLRAISRPSFIFHFVPKTLILSVASVLVGAIVQLGFAFFIIPGLYLLIATSFTIPLILDRGMTPFQAIATSIKIINKRWVEFIKVFGFFVLLGLLVAITFGIALIWVLPFYYNVKGVLYREVVGIQVKVVQLENQQLKSDNIFHA